MYDMAEKVEKGKNYRVEMVEKGENENILKLRWLRKEKM